MQIIEVTDLGVRSAVLILKRRETAMQFMVFPMIHFAEARFYASVQKRLGDCQIVVAEGIQGPSASTRAITRSYRLLKHKKSLGMVEQNLDYDVLDAEIVRPDLTGEAMDDAWGEIPLRQRVLTELSVPIFAAWMLGFGTRRVIAHELATDDLPSPQQQADEDAMRESFGETEELIMDRRDQLLIDALARIHEEHCTEPIKVAVVYGAHHVTPMVRALHRRFGYIARRGEWLDMMSL